MPKPSAGLVFRILLSSFPLFCFASASSGYGAGFQVKIGRTLRPFALIGTFLLPGEVLPIEAVSASGADGFTLSASEGNTQTVSAREWNWRAPLLPGLYVLQVQRVSPADSVRIHAFVMVPFDRLKGEYLNGYHIGRYPAAPSANYRNPRGFIEVTRATEGALVSPHFQLKQFLCKQGGGYPKYLALSERLLLKLEMLLAKANEKGYRVASFHVMSGYRTPAYNHALGNVKLSRHQFGDAADIYIEDPRTGQMADLNGDGRVDAQDAAVLYGMVQELSQTRPEYFPVGGAGTYESNPAHGPFLHVDARGFPAKWGTILRTDPQTVP